MAGTQTYKLNYGGKEIDVNRSMDNGYLADYDVYRQAKEATANAYKEQLANNLETDKNTVNSNYDNAARQAYVEYMKKQKQLPSQLQALGVRGGATESGLLNLYNNYGTSHASNEASRNTALSNLQQTYNNDLANYQQEYDSDLANALATALNNQRKADTDELNMFASSVAQYPTTASGYDQYVAWINTMSASSDPLKEYKIAMIRQQMASQFPSGRPASYSYSGGGYSGGGYTYDEPTVNTSYNPSLKGSTIGMSTNLSTAGKTRRQISQSNDLKAARNKLW